jgi:iron complex transport system substrate-binding protein
VLSIARGKDSVEAETVFAHSAFAMTPAARGRAFISMEGLYLLGFGPRTAAAARDLAVKLYPALAPQADKFTPAALSADCRK